MPATGCRHQREMNSLQGPSVTDASHLHRHRRRRPPRRAVAARVCGRLPASDGAARGHRAHALGQDRVPHRAHPQPTARRTAAGIRGDGVGTHRARAARAAARRRSAAVRLRIARARADRGARLAGVDAPHQRAAHRHRIPVGERASAHAHPRHRRLSGRVAARPAAADEELRRMVGRDLGAVAAAAPPRPRRRLARASREPAAGGSRGRAGGARGGAAVHRLPAGGTRRAARPEPAAARPLPDAGRSRRLAGAHLRAARAAG